MYKFTWDSVKAALNKQKHGVSFEEAMTSFDDNNALFMADPDHAEEEDRFLLLGYSFSVRLLLVVHCYRENESVIRIISARKATRHERKTYHERRDR